MPGLNPLMNAQPRQQIPNEAPAYFSPFFEQPEKPAPVAIWQPPNIESSLRSKANNVTRTPVNIPTAGSWPESKRAEEDKNKKGLYQPKPKKGSADEMMWLGSVNGFSLPNPSLQSDKTYIKTKLVRKPEEKASQASALTGPKASEERKKKEEEAKARERRLEEWATRKKQKVAEDKKANEAGVVALPQPEKSSSNLNRPYAPRSISGIKPKIFHMIPQPSDTTSYRSNATHRPNYPNNEISFAPSNPILPQPIETVRRSNRSQNNRPKEKATDEMLWMGLPEPIETIRRSNRKSPLSSDSHTKKLSHNDAQTSADPVTVATLPQPIESVKRSNRPSSEQKIDTPDHVLPQPIESIKRSNRPDPNKKDEILPEPIETTRKSNRPLSKEILPEPIESTRKSNRTSREILPEPIETSRKSNKTPKEILPEPVETIRKSNRPTSKEVLPEPVESTRRSNRPIQEEVLPEPIETSVKFNRETPKVVVTKPIETINKAARLPTKEILPEPVETTRKSNRPVTKEILPEPIETIKKSNRPSIEKPLPEPVETTKKSNRPAAEAKEILPEPIETSKRSSREEKELPQPIESTQRSNRPSAAPLQRAFKPSPPTPTASFFFGPDDVVQQPPRSESFRRPMQVRPLIAQPIETSMRTTRTKVLPPEPLDLPVPASSKVEKWTNQRTPIARHPRRRSTIFQNKHPTRRPRDRVKLSGHSVARNWTRPDDHVEHLHEPIDSQPGSPEGTPPTSNCPSLSSSPTSSASSAWDASKSAKEPVLRAHDGGFEAYVRSIEKALRETGAVGTPAKIRERKKEEPFYPFPETEPVPKSISAEENISAARSDTSDTVRPKLRAVISDPGQLQEQVAEDDYPICHSPVHENFKRPEPEEQSKQEKPKDSKNSENLTITVPDPSEASKLLLAHTIAGDPTGTYSAPPRMFYQPLSPSPGYTVASRPPKAKKDVDATEEVSDQFVDEVYGYLSLGFDSIARKFDQEIADYTGSTLEEVRKDRKAAVARYCRRWVKDNPHIATGEMAKGGLW